jgi:hypothetical protein
MSVSAWRSIIANNMRNHLSYPDSHTRQIFEALHTEISKYKRINGHYTDSIVNKINELTNLGKNYKDENYLATDKEILLCESIKNDINKIAPKKVMKLVSFEEWMIKKGFLNPLESNWNKFYEHAFSVDKLYMSPTK